MSNVFESEFWASLYFAGLGGRSNASDPNAMRGLFVGGSAFTGHLASVAAPADAVRRGGKDDRRRPVVPQYVEWTKERVEAVERHNRQLFEALLDPEEAPPLPAAETGKITAAQELERVSLLMLTAMQAAQEEARRKDRERLRKQAKRNKVAVPVTAEETRALVVWLAKRAEALRQAQQEEQDEEEMILLLAA